MENVGGQAGKVANNIGGHYNNVGGDLGDAFVYTKNVGGHSSKSVGGHVENVDCQVSRYTAKLGGC